MTLAIEWCHCENCIPQPRPTFLINKYLDVDISETVRASENVKNDFCRYGYFPANDATAKFTPSEIDLHFEGKKYEILIYRKQ